MMRNFKQLFVWQTGIIIAEKAFRLVKQFPQEDQFCKGRQISRAAVSIPSNVAEGNSRTSEKHKLHYLEIAMGSCFELETQLLLVQLLKIGDNELVQEMLRLLEQEEKMLHTLMKKIKIALKAAAPPSKG